MASMVGDSCNANGEIGLQEVRSKYLSLEEFLLLFVFAEVLENTFVARTVTKNEQE